MASQFARARAPYLKPTGAELAARYRLFAIDPEAPSCAYCGSTQSEWDHLYPMVELAALLVRSERIAAQLRTRYQALAAALRASSG